MKPGRLRLIMHLGSLALVAVIFSVLPFSFSVNAAIAAAFWMLEGAMTEYVFSKRATLAEKARDLRDRVDNPS